MSLAWHDDQIRLARPQSVRDWVRVLWRGGTVGGLVYGSLAVLLLLRLIEKPLFGLSRPWTPHLAQWVCRLALPMLGIGLLVRGKPMDKKGVVVANHSSWLDIFALNALQRVYFVSKSEVEGWVGLGWLARATGTVFIARKGTEAKVQQELFENRLRAGHKLLFFPEGTSTDAIRVLPFKSTLFAALFTHGLNQIVHVQPVTVLYHAPEGADPRHFGWWGEMEFGAHLMAMLTARTQGHIEVIFHPPVGVDQFANRKDLAAYCEAVIRSAHSLART